MSKWQDLYKQKLMTADQAVKSVKNGDWVEFSPFVTVPWDLDAALAKRKNELKKVYIRCATLTWVPEVFKVDPQGDVFLICDGSFSATTRKMKEQGEVYINPQLYHEAPLTFTVPDVNYNDYMFTAVTPMDKNGFFCMSTSCSHDIEIIRARATTQKNLKVVVEVNPGLPVVHGENFLHITEVDTIVETSTPKKPMAIPKVEGTPVEQKIAENIMKLMVDGACLQLGIGGIPNLVGKALVNSEFKDLGCHSEMFVDAYMELFNAGKLTNARKQQDVGKSVFTFAMGSADLYEFCDNNPSLRCISVKYTNDPAVIARNDNVISICSGLAVDLFGNVSSESVGYKQISGVGGQWDYHYAAFHSKGGKSFICLPSAKTTKDGRRVSNIVVTHDPGTQITVTGHVTNWVVTELGAVNLKGKTTWEKVELLASVAHPDFRDEIFKAAEKARLWRAQNKNV
jgi:acyl-CoA hydrolase